LSPAPDGRAAATALRQLQRERLAGGDAAAGRKLLALTVLARTRLASAGQVRRLHETLCFLRAHPGDARVLAAVERLLARFDRRADLAAHREALASDGIAGTAGRYPFFWPTARWLASRWPGRLRFDRSDFEADLSLARAAPLLAPPLVAAALRERKHAGFAAIDRLRRRGETDAACLVRLVAAMPGDEATREGFYDAINPSCELRAGPDTPARCREKFGPAPVVFRDAPLDRGRPKLRQEMARPPLSLRRLGRDEGRQLIDLARGVMVTRNRDLDAFAYGNADDAWLIDDGGGRAFALNGVLLERRPPIASIYGGLTLANGVPVGYLQADVVGRSAALSFNTFETFRGGEAAHDFARLLAALRHFAGVDAFSIEPYQLGLGNDEGIASGAWWFYFKLGFRPRAAAARRLTAAELALIDRKPSHRSSAATLRRLAAHPLFFDLDPSRHTPLPPLADIGLRVARLLAGRGDSAPARIEGDAAALLDARPASMTASERAAFANWAPLVLLAGAARWPRPQRLALRGLVGAKAAASERDYAMRLAAHAPLCRALFGQ